MITKANVITHRGLEPTKTNFFSESSYEAFKDQLSRGFAGIEFDLNLTRDGIIVFHDANLTRITSGKDIRNIADMMTTEVTGTLLSNGRIPTLDDVMNIIRNSEASLNALHLKARFQNSETLGRLITALKKHEDILAKFIVFDVKEDSAKKLKEVFPHLRLAPSVAHPYDIERYNDSVGGTLMTIEDAIVLKKKNLIDGIWGDEWDTIGENGTSKQLYTKDNFDRLHDTGLFIALVTPELHGTSPGLYGGESHADARDTKTLFARIKQIKEAGPDYFCTDYPEEVAKI
jgi:glycerophosphoryl diester phosphodiesterase